MSKKTKRQSKLFEWQQRAANQEICERCGKHVGTLTVDHIIPLSIVEMLDITGELKIEWEDNFQIVCFPCNKFKSSRIDFANPKTIPLLKELINRL